MFPNAPNVQGAPLWLQVLVCLAFVLSTGWAAFLGYRKRLEREPVGAAQTLVAAFPDMTAIRQLTDQTRVLGSQVESLDSNVRELTHHLRNATETGNQLCLHSRELKEEIARHDRQQARQQAQKG